MRVIIAVVTSLVIWSSLTNAETSGQYQSKEFADPNSRVPNLFLCAYLGTSTGLAPDANEVLIRMMNASGVTNERIDIWAKDTIVYIKYEISPMNLDPALLWQGECEEPFSRMRQDFPSE